MSVGLVFELFKKFIPLTDANEPHEANSIKIVRTKYEIGLNALSRHFPNSLLSWYLLNGAVNMQGFMVITLQFCNITQIEQVCSSSKGK